jgi:hypothetical protein
MLHPSPYLHGPGDIGGDIHNKAHALTRRFGFLPILSVAHLNNPPEHDQVKKWHALLVYMYCRVGRSFEYPFVGGVEGEKLL